MPIYLPEPFLKQALCRVSRPASILPGEEKQTILGVMKTIPLFLAGLFLGMASMRAESVNASVASVSGTAEFASATSFGFHPLKKGQLLAAGTTVRTGEDGNVVLTATPGSAIKIAPNSILKVNELAFAQSGSQVTERKARLQLTSGLVSALVDPSTPKVTDFQIQTPQGAAAARGTFYAVAVYDGKTYVGVQKGRVAATTTSN
jgi:hypothetical protein